MILPTQTQGVTDFQKYLVENLQRLKDTGRPELLSVNGGQEIVVQDATSYGKLLEAVELLETLEKIQQGFEEFDRGDSITLDEFLVQMKKEHGFEYHEEYKGKMKGYMRMALNISLPQELENIVNEKVNMGLYQSASEVVHEALRDFFSKPTEGQILAHFIKTRLNEINESGEAFVNADLSQLKQIRREIKRK